MKSTNFSFQRLASLLVILVIVTYVLMIAKSLLIPLVFSLLLVLLLKPICAFFERYVKSRLLSIFITFLITGSIATGVISLFTFQFVHVIQDLPNIESQLKMGLNTLFDLLNDNFGISRQSGEEWLRQNLSSVIETPLSFLTNSLSSSTTILASFFLTLLYAAFFLFYRSSLRNFIIYQFPPEKRPAGEQLLKDIQQVMQQYLYGLAIVIVILGFLNSIGLWLIGINYAFFWGFLAAFLAIIPYIGTTLGGTLPFLYALATTATFWQPAAVVVLYFSVQQLEGNLITPNIVGSSININPLVAILALLVGGYIWGIAGLILSMPTVAVIKILFDHSDALKPVSVLLGNNLYKDKDIFKEEYDDDQYRLKNLFID